jgi:ATP phosphoribosyltransferase
MIKLGIPSKGRLMDKTFDWFGARGVTLSLTGGAREYAGTVEGVDSVELVLLSAGEIPRELAAGHIHAGVTGLDMVREKLPAWENRVGEVVRLGFGRADLIIAVPDFWTDVTTLDDLDAAATQFRRIHGHRMRIATKYHRLVREFLRAAQVSDYQLVDSQGATEGTVKNLTAEAIADITSTGETLRANHLRVLEDAIVLRSEAALFKTRAPVWDAKSRAAWDALQRSLT